MNAPGVPRVAMAEMIAASGVRPSVLALRSGVSDRTLRRIRHGTRSGNGGRRYRGVWVDLDVADRICMALDERLPE